MSRLDQFDDSSLGVGENYVAAAAYLPLLNIVLYIVEQQSTFVRFHAMQSIMSFTTIGILWLIGRIVHPLFFISPFMGVISFFFAGYMMHKAFDGLAFKLPVFGNLAESVVIEVTAHDDEQNTSNDSTHNGTNG